MRSSTQPRTLTRRHRTALGLAPDLDPRWSEEFAIELRCQGVGGARIGDALAEASSHCRQSQESALAAFGDPAGYARSLHLPIHTNTSARAMLASLSPVVLQVLGMWMLIRGFTAWRGSGQLQVTTAQLAAVAALVPGAMFLARFGEAVVRLCARHRHAVLFIAVGSGAGLELGLSSRFHSEGIWWVAAGWSLAAGAAVLAGGSAWAIARYRARPQDGPVTSPLGAAGGHPSDVGPGLGYRLLSSPLIGTALTWLGTLFLLAVIWGLAS